MEFKRTPDERFTDLPDFPYAPHYLEGLAGFDDLRLHYLDEGPEDAEHVFLCLHGEPSWSFVYRKMMPVFLEAGGRVVAPDYFGFGRSDKPVEDEVYTFDFHRRAIVAFIERLNLSRLTLVCQDWGGLIGLTLPMDMPGRFERLLIMNTALGTARSKPPEGFLAWRQYVADNPDFDVGGLMGRAAPGLSEAELRAYEAPFPDPSYKAGVRRFPAIVPVTEDMPGVAESRRAARWWSEAWSGPTFMAIGAQDPVLGPPVMKKIAQLIRGCPEPVVFEQAGHFVQEHGAPVAEAALAAFGEQTP